MAVVQKVYPDKSRLSDVSCAARSDFDRVNADASLPPSSISYTCCVQPAPVMDEREEKMFAL